MRREETVPSKREVERLGRELPLPDFDADKPPLQEGVEQLLLTGVHDLPVAGRVVVVAAEVEGPVDDVEEDLALEGEAALARLAPRGVRRDDDLPEEVVLLVLEREAHDVRRSGHAEEVDVDPRDRAIVHEGDREPSVRAALGGEDEARERLELAGVRVEAPLLVRDLDARHGAGSLTAPTEGS